MANLVNRRRFLEIGTLGVGYGAIAPHASATQSNHSIENTVRMVGDGLGLSPSELADTWTQLATKGEIEPDSYSNGGTVEHLETACAVALGKERAVFMPTGTLANHLAVRELAGGTGRAIVQAESHLYNDSGDCVQNLTNMPLVALGVNQASFSVEHLDTAVERAQTGRVETPIRVISIETPVRRRFGETFDGNQLERVVAFAKQREISLHLDGARIFLQAAYENRPVSDYTAPFDTVYVSLYKYFNAPSGAILAGPRSLLDGMFHTRRMFGAGLPAAWPFAAIAHHYLPGFTTRFRRAVDTSEAWVELISNHDAFVVERIKSGTNLLRLRVTGTDPQLFRAKLERAGIVIGRPRGTGQFLIAVNETWNRRPADEIATVFVEALG
jgi:threonine aldolase